MTCREYFFHSQIESYLQKTKVSWLNYQGCINGFGYHAIGHSTNIQSKSHTPPSQTLTCLKSTIQLLIWTNCAHVQGTFALGQSRSSSSFSQIGRNSKLCLSVLDTLDSRNCHVSTRDHSHTRKTIHQELRFQNNRVHSCRTLKEKMVSRQVQSG